MSTKLRHAFLAAGHIGTILAKGLAPHGEGKTILTRRRSPFDPSLLSDFECGYDNKAAARSAGIIFIGPKPKEMDALLSEIKSEIESDTILISMVGRRTLHEIQGAVGWCNAYRIMPSILSSINRGVILVAEQPGASEQTRVRQLLMHISEGVLFVSEELLHMGTVFLGSMPAIVAYFLKDVKGTVHHSFFDRTVRSAIISSANDHGFRWKDAEMIFENTLDGVITLLRNGHTCEGIIEEVATPGGCTRAILDTYEEIEIFSAIGSGNVLAELVSNGLDAGIQKLLSM